MMSLSQEKKIIWRNIEIAVVSREKNHNETKDEIQSMIRNKMMWNHLRYTESKGRKLINHET